MVKRRRNKQFNHEVIVNLCWRYCEIHFDIRREEHSFSSDFFDEFLADPLDHDEMMRFVEDTFDIEPTDDEMYAVKTFLDLITLIESKIP